MNPLALGLIFVSTFMHAGWNLLARRQRAEALFFHRMLTASAVLGLAPALVSVALTHSLTPKVWGLAAASGVCCGLYYFFLARAYRDADFTTVYPVARALPVLLVAIGDVLRARPPTPRCWLGLALVAAGCLLAPLASLRDAALRRYLNRASLWMLLTALGTVGYTLFDKVASEAVPAGPASAARYGYVFFVASWVVYTVLLTLSRTDLSDDVGIGWRGPSLAATLNFGAYWLVLWAYQLERQASTIVAFRQFSIVIGVVLAFAIYRERGLRVRMAGAVLITGGLVIVGLWGG